MRFVIVPSPSPSPSPAQGSAAAAHVQPDDATMAAYMKFNEDMHRAGVLIASEGINPAKPSARVVLSGGKRRVVDGPYTESKELLGGFWIIEVPSLEEATAWAARCPTGLGFDEVLDIRPLTDATDLPPRMLEIIRESAPTWAATWDKARRST
jgi:hypothetical protein